MSARTAGTFPLPSVTEGVTTTRSDLDHMVLYRVRAALYKEVAKKLDDLILLERKNMYLDEYVFFFLLFLNLFTKHCFFVYKKQKTKNNVL